MNGLKNWVSNRMLCHRKDDEMARECNTGYMVLRDMTKGTMVIL